MKVEQTNEFKTELLSANVLKMYHVTEQRSDRQIFLEKNFFEGKKFVAKIACNFRLRRLLVQRHVRKRIPDWKRYNKAQSTCYLPNLRDNRNE
jgi:hypothetical protein